MNSASLSALTRQRESAFEVRAEETQAFDRLQGKATVREKMHSSPYAVNLSAECERIEEERRVLQACVVNPTNRPGLLD